MEKRWLSIRALGDFTKDLKSHGTTMLLVAGVLALPTMFSTTISAVGAEFFGGLLSLFSIFFVAGWLPYAIILGTRSFAAGEQLGAGELIDRSANRRLLSFFGAQILLGLLVIGVILLFALPLLALGASTVLRGVSTGGPGPGTAIFALGVLILIPGAVAAIILILLRYGLAPTVTALEGISPTRSFSRSRELLRGRAWDFLTLLAIVIMINLVISMIVSGPGAVVSRPRIEPDRLRELGPLGLLSEMSAPRAPLAPGAAVLLGVSTYLSSVITGILMAGSIANYYLRAKGEEVRESHLPSPVTGALDTGPSDETETDPDHQ